MHKVLVDEDMPRSLAVVLRRHGIDAHDVRDVGLRSAPDQRIFAYGVDERSTIVTGDLGFAHSAP